ncbi:inositol 1,4,5-trisphosphate receptor-interacting protein-like [Protopterus annectens]|uniref:inositol 1,4,5-trisphosphate receptor-interacting protein-like n=1 Tax=Protopterus annectens TaxID=7888 RepID=UPI001CFC3DB6|nr:inositol 1,4,5-trisphosphate receptor-interacting protein-like [Protopterus annectens]XP_043937481.1 inositol 1,4,5-trisphosphate receptor-interacting protein-like [Protopterus annectens]XP_043937482.1 inositol 1,4,5-trisphosphate receptor-interacting protein-like [Protopterus annectens]XP_043937483.1 inositol 1,4,5-trisphosphate receptor-interacting protein-like [Protopterus annectens]
MIMIIFIVLIITFVLGLCFNRNEYKHKEKGQSLHSPFGIQHINFCGMQETSQSQCNPHQEPINFYGAQDEGQSINSSLGQHSNLYSAQMKTHSAYHNLADRITFSNDEMEKYTTIAENTVMELIAQMKKELLRGDPEICSDFIRTGSSFEGLKVKPEVEFDFMITLLPPPTFNFYLVSVINEIPKMFSKIGVSENGFKMMLLQSSKSVFQKPMEFKEKFCKGDYFQSLAVNRWFQSLADRAIKTLPKISPDVRFSQQGPARTMKIRKSGFPEISVDLVPAVYINGMYLVAKTYGGIMEENYSLKDTLWRMSFSIQEKTFLEEISSSLPTNSCHQKTLQILKYLKQSTPSLHWSAGLSSYHLKTVWLHMLQNKSSYDWKYEKLDQRVLELIDNLLTNLGKRALHYFFIGNPELLCRDIDLPKDFLQYHIKCNLFNDINQTTIEQAYLQLVQLKNQIDSTIEELCATL